MLYANCMFDVTLGFDPDDEEITVVFSAFNAEGQVVAHIHFDPFTPVTIIMSDLVNKLGMDVVEFFDAIVEKCAQARLLADNNAHGLVRN